MVCRTFDRFHANSRCFLHSLTKIVVKKNFNYQLEASFDRKIGSDETFRPVALLKKVYTDTKKKYIIVKSIAFSYHSESEMTQTKRKNS